MSSTSQTAIEFEELVTPHIDALLRTARRMVSDPGEAEDLVQESLLKGYRFFGRFERDSNFKAWIFKILMNTFVNIYRRRQRQGPSVDLDAVGDMAATEPDDDEAVVAAPTFVERERAVLDLVDDKIKQALMDLPVHLRIVFMLNVIEGLKYREIAKILECPVGTVMSRLFRGRAMLRERLGHYADERKMARE